MTSIWPRLSFEDAKETYQTLHLWTQIVGKIKLARLPWINHSWHVTLLVTPSGLTTSLLPDKNQHFQIDFDFVVHQLKITTAYGEARQFELNGISVADFYKRIFDAMTELKIEVKINPMPNEIENAILFHQDTLHATYHADQVTKLHKALLKAQDVLTQFRSEFRGKCSPVHFFWGSFDLAVSRFSGRRAPTHPGGVPNLPDRVAREAYSNEVSSCGFWPGSEVVPFAAFYAYIYPEPDGFNKTIVNPPEAYYHELLKEFILPYDVVRQAQNPERILLDFLHSTYNAGADLAQWDREALEEKVN